MNTYINTEDLLKKLDDYEREFSTYSKMLQGSLTGAHAEGQAEAFRQVKSLIYRMAELEIR